MNITDYILSFIGVLLTIILSLIVYVWNEEKKITKEKFIRKQDEIDDEKRERGQFKKEIINELSKERDSREKLADKIFLRVDQFATAIAQCQAHIETIFKQIKEIKEDIKALEKNNG